MQEYCLLGGVPISDNPSILKQGAEILGQGGQCGVDQRDETAVGADITARPATGDQPGDMAADATAGKGLVLQASRIDDEITHWADHRGWR
ncbi:MAG: hypothetical protein B7Z57_07930 [Acidiphilium sp. 37-60-79]|nr:MAG: hypothetical protein B7Z57_07930 [Acidiphilium sp. 37-60-79]